MPASSRSRPQNGAKTAVFNISARLAGIAWQQLAVAEPASAVAAQPCAAQPLARPSAAGVAAERSPAVVAAHSPVAAAVMASQSAERR